jgi:general secretion pathway protein A
MWALGMNFLRAIPFSSTIRGFFLKRDKLLNLRLSFPKLDLFSQQIICEFYDFSKDPFAAEPDPRLFYLNENVKEVWNSILSGIVQRKGFLLLTGEKGMGKTIFISLIFLYLTLNIRNVKVIPQFDPSQKLEEIVQSLLWRLGLPLQWSKSRMLSRLEWELTQRSACGETVVLIIDEAQNLKRETLEEIRFLANPSPNIPNLLQTIFVGDLQFEKNLRSKDLSFLNQRIEVRCRLRPFTPEESLGYIEHRLRKAGSTTSRVFTPGAVFLIIQSSGGNPGTLNRICEEALSVGYNQFKERIDPANMREILANLGIKKGHGWLLPPKTLPRIKKGLRKF